MKNIFTGFSLKVSITTAALGLVVLSGMVFILPRALNIGQAMVCPGATDNVSFQGNFDTTYIGEGCKDFPTVTLRNVNGSYPESAQALSQGIQAQAGDEIYVRIWVHNGAVTGGEAAENVQINVNVPSNGNDHNISANISASNDHGRGASGAMAIHTQNGEILEIVPGSVEVFSDQGNPLGLPGGFHINGPTSFSFDRLEACFEFAKFVRFKVRVVAAPVTPPTQVSGNISGQVDGQVAGQCLFKGTVHWETFGTNDAIQVTVRNPDTGEEALFAGAPSGNNDTINWFEPDKNYRFTVWRVVNGQRVSFYGPGNNLETWVVVGPLNCNTPPPPTQEKTFTLTTNGEFCVGQTPLYTITGTANLVGKAIYWSSTLNGSATGENNSYVGQTISNSNGLAFWSNYGGTWQTSHVGNWTKTATIDGVSRQVSFSVKDCTPAQPKDFTLVADGQVCVGQNTRYTITSTANLVGKSIIWSSTFNNQITGENNAYVGQIIFGTNGLGFWSDVGSAWQTSHIGNWTKTATIDGISKTVSFSVKDCAPVTPQLVCSPANQTAQARQTVYFSAAGGSGSYSWVALGATGGQNFGQSFSAVYSTAGNKVVTLTSGSQSVNCNVTIIVNPPADLICSPVNQTVDINQTVYFTAFGATGSFNWSAPGASNASGNGSAFNTSYATSGNKIVTVTSGNQSKNCEVFVKPVIVPVLQCTPANQTVDPNQPAYLTAIGGNGSYTWSANGGNPASGNGITFATSFATSGNKVVNLTSAGQTTNCNVEVKNVPPPVKSFTLIADSFCVGGQPRYTITGTSNLVGKQIVWSSTLNGQAFGSQTVAGTLRSDNSGLAFWTDLGSPWTTAQLGNWTKTATIDGITKTVFFTVKDCNPPSDLVCSPVNQTANIGQTVYFTATGGNGNYSWVALGATGGQNSNQSFNASYSAAGNKVVTVSSAGKTANCNVTITSIVVQQVVCAPSIQIVNIGQTASFVASGGNGSYTWSAPNSTNTSGSNQTFVTTYNSAGNYAVTVSSNGQNSSCNVIVNQNQQPQLFCSPPNQTANLNQTVWFSAFGGNGNYSWSAPGASQASGSGASFSSSYSNSGTYVATVTSGNQTATCQVQVIFQQPPQVICSPAFQTVQVGQTVWFTAIGGNSSYIWSAPSAQTPNGNGQSFSTSYTNAGNYAATVTSNGQNATCNVFVQGQVLGGNVNLVFSKRAINETKNADATTLNASKEDFITYTLTVTNTGNQLATNFVITDDLSGVLPYADMVDRGGANLNGNVIAYSALDIPAGGSVSKSFKVRVKYFLADNLSYTMTNTYGNTVAVHINTPQIKGEFIAPKTGADTLAFAFGGSMTAGYAVFKKRRSILGFILN